MADHEADDPSVPGSESKPIDREVIANLLFGDDLIATFEIESKDASPGDEGALAEQLAVEVERAITGLRHWLDETR